MHQASHGVATEIHECSWSSQQQLLTSYIAEAYSGPALPLVEVDRMKPGEVIQALEADIVAITGVILAGIPQTKYEFHLLEAYGNTVSGHYG